MQSPAVPQWQPTQVRFSLCDGACNGVSVYVCVTAICTFRLHSANRKFEKSDSKNKSTDAIQHSWHFTKFYSVASWETHKTKWMNLPLGDCTSHEHDDFEWELCIVCSEWIFDDSKKYHEVAWADCSVLTSLHIIFAACMMRAHTLFIIN